MKICITREGLLRVGDSFYALDDEDPWLEDPRPTADQLREAATEATLTDDPRLSRTA